MPKAAPTTTPFAHSGGEPGPLNLSEAQKTAHPRRLLMAVAAVLGAGAAQSLNVAGHSTWGLGLYAIAVILMVQSGLAQAVPTASSTDTTVAEKADYSARPARARSIWGRVWHGPAVVSTALIAAVICAICSWIYFDFARPSHTAWNWYLAGVGALVMAVLADSLRPPRVRWGSAAAPSRRVRWLVMILAAAIFVVAAVVRLWQLDSLPFGTWYDEAANGLEALRIVNEPDFRPVYNDGVNASGHYLALIALFFDLFGTSTYSIRLISALMGIGLVVAAFQLGRVWLGLWGGLILALLLAFSRWAINFSRLGMYNISTPLLAVAALYFLVQAYRTRRTRDFVLSGAAAGAGLLFYSAYYLFLPVLGLVALILLIRERTGWHTLLVGYLVALLAAGVILAPTIKVAVERPDQYFGRVQTTSLWANTAPDARFNAILRNTVRHVQMFHGRGDPNGRHNLPGRPMLDPVVGGLMVLGIAICLLRPRWWPGSVILAWLCLGLVGGILSLDFESPQSLRAIGAMPPAYLLATLPLVGVMQMAIQGLRGPLAVGGHFAGYLACGTVLALLTASGWVELRTYFVIQARDFAAWNAHSTPETLAARVLAGEPGVAEGTVQPYVISLFDGHPTLRFLAPAALPVTRLETTESLPLIVPPDQDWFLIVDAERRYLYEEAQSLYPDGTFRTHSPPFGGPAVLYTMRIPVAAQQSVQGGRRVAVWGDATGQSSLEIVDSRAWLAASADLQGGESRPITRIEWESVLAVPGYGPYLFHIEGDLPAQLWIGGELVAERAVGQNNAPERDHMLGQTLALAIVLAEGMHPLRVQTFVDTRGPEQRATGVSAGEVDGRVRIFWRPPDRDWEEIPRWHYFHTPSLPQGLAGRYFANGAWQEPEAFARIDTRWDMYFHVIPLARPYTVEWTGLLRVLQPGEYGLALQARDEATLWLNEEAIAISAGGEQSRIWRSALPAGEYPIRIRFADTSNHTSLRLLWETPAGGGLRPIPAGFLRPLADAYERVDTPYVAPFLAEQGDGAADSAWMSQESMPDEVIRVLPTIVAEGLNQPTGIAVAGGLIWVAEPRAGRVRAFAPDGTQRYSVEQGLTAEFQEPTALARVRNTDSTGGEILLVLDAETGIVHRFDAESGAALDPLPLSAEIGRRSRGISVDDTGAIWIAATSRGELVRVDGQGAVRQVVPMRSGGDQWTGAQPVSALALEGGSLLAADGGLHKLVAFDNAGRRRIAWDIPAANTFAGMDLARMPHDIFVRSVPEQGLLIAHETAGRPLAAWDLRGPELPAAHPVGLAVDESGILWVTDTHAGVLLRVVPPELPSDDGEQ